MTKLTHGLFVAAMLASVAGIAFVDTEDAAAQGTAGAPGNTGGGATNPPPASGGSDDSDDGGGCSLSGNPDSRPGIAALGLAAALALAARRRRS
jgi:MYXO-CTERM domain-containing protein